MNELVLYRIVWPLAHFWIACITLVVLALIIGGVSLPILLLFVSASLVQFDLDLHESGKEFMIGSGEINGIMRSVEMI